MKSGGHHSETTRKLISESHKGKQHSEETKQKIRETMKGTRIGVNHPRYGMHHSEETKKKISSSNLGMRRHWNEESKKKLSISKSGKNNPLFEKKLPEELKIKMGMYSRNLERAPNWQGGISFEPYCPKFNKEFKERVRAFFGYKCVECGLSEGEKKLAIHHVNFNKMSCCDSTKPLFVALCASCHAKTNGNRQYWEKHFTEIIMEYYNGYCFLK